MPTENTLGQAINETIISKLWIRPSANKVLLILALLSATTGTYTCFTSISSPLGAGQQGDLGYADQRGIRRALSSALKRLTRLFYRRPQPDPKPKPDLPPSSHPPSKDPETHPSASLNTRTFDTATVLNIGGNITHNIWVTNVPSRTGDSLPPTQQFRCPCEAHHSY